GVRHENEESPIATKQERTGSGLGVLRAAAMTSVGFAVLTACSPNVAGQGSSSTTGGSVSVDPSFAGSGWPSFTPSVDTRTVYVSSSSGDDQHDGLSPATSKRTVAAGQALLRSGYPDWL